MHADKPEAYRDDALIHDITTADAAIWIAVCASLPVLLAMVEMAFYADLRFLHLSKQHVANGLIATIVLVPPLCGFLQWYALQRFAPRLRLWLWLPAGAVSLAIALGAVRWVTFNERRFELALSQWRMQDSVDAAVAMQMCLGLAALVGGGAIVAAAKSLLQSLVLGLATRVSWRLFLAAAVSGAVVATIVEQLATLPMVYRPSELNTLDWGRRFVELGLRASFGAIYGVVSVYVVMKLLPRDVDADANERVGHRQLGKFLLIAGVASLFVPASIGVIGRDGGRSALASLLKTFAFAPAVDRSQGEAILNYSHTIEVVPGKFPVIRFAPDSRTFLMLDEKRGVMLVDVATGRTLGQLAETLVFYEGYDVAWNSDASVLALRTWGAEEKMAGNYTRYLPRIRTYAMPGRQLLREYQPAGYACYEIHARVSLIFAPDDASVWTVCGQNTEPQSEDIMAIQLDAVSLRPLTLKKYGEEYVAGMPRTLGISGGHVVYLQHRNSKEIAEIRLGRLDGEFAPLHIGNMGVAGLADGLTPQWEVIEQDHIVADYCGIPASTAPGSARSVCRQIQLDAVTGAVKNITDEPDRRFMPLRYTLSARTGLRIESSGNADSKRVEITVRDRPDSEIRQRIETYEQRPLAFSPDMRWLVTHAPGKRTLNVYRVAP